MKKEILLLILLTLITGISVTVSAQERFVLPVDEGTKDASFVKFRENLIAAVKKKDKKQLIGILDPEVKASFGGDDGIEDFEKFWELETSNSKVWDELLPVLINGGKFVGEGGSKQFCAPYSFSAFPDDIDAFEYNVIFGNNVRLRSRPDLSSKVIEKLSYNIVKIDFGNSVTNGKDEASYIWYRIETLGKKKGFVSAAFVRSPIDYRACFEKKKGVWKMTAFVAGD